MACESWSCVAACRDSCWGCSGGCQGCTAACAFSCWSCSGSCEGGCKGCSGSCSGGCSGCSGSCSGGCSGCSGTCSGTCSGGCKGSCSGCSGSCSGSCSGCSGCTACTGTCTDACNNGCTGGNVTTIYNNLTLSTIIKASEMTDLKTLIENELTRRSLTKDTIPTISVGTKAVIGVATGFYNDLVRAGKSVTAESQNNLMHRTVMQSYIDAAKALYTVNINP